MNILAVTALAASLVIVRPALVDPDAAIDRFEKECAGDATSAPCAALRGQVEQILLQDLLTLQAADAEISPEIYRLAAKADTPLLRAVALRGLARHGFDSSGDVALLQAALESAVPALRIAALQAASQVGDKRILSLKARAAEGRYANTPDRDEVGAAGSILPDKVPDAKQLGVALYPGATYQFFASSAALAFFTSSDPPEKAIAFYTSSLKDQRTYTKKELEQLVPAGPDPNATIEMTKGGAQNPMAQRLKAAKAWAEGRYDWGKGFEGHQGVEDPRYVIVDEADKSGRRVPTKVVAIFNDKLLGQTAIVVPRPPSMPDDWRADPGRYRRLLQRLNRKLQPEPEGSDPDEGLTWQPYEDTEKIRVAEQKQRVERAAQRLKAYAGSIR